MIYLLIFLTHLGVTGTAALTLPPSEATTVTWVSFLITGVVASIYMGYKIRATLK